MGIEWLGWREALMLLVAALGLYLAFLIVRLIGLRDSLPPPATEAAAKIAAREPQIAESGEDTRAEEGAGSTHAMPKETMREVATSAVASHEPERTSDKADAHWSGGFGEQLAAYLAKSEMERELQALREEVQRLRQEVESLRVASIVSPHYGEAMTLIERGMSARQAADQLGISLAEAELIEALIRRRFVNESGEDDGEPHHSQSEPSPTRG
ncbi:MAG: DUF2802 domain-containing protein [Rhodocyclaceae bacterium]|nr:DUF2802 domain-containing protein [Rhodocyclaceae bacterium]